MTTKPTLEELAREHAEKLHEYFEWVRNDPLRVPDSDQTETILLRFAAAHRELIKQELEPVREALESCEDWQLLSGRQTKTYNTKLVSAALRTLENLGGPSQEKK